MYSSSVKNIIPFSNKGGWEMRTENSNNGTDHFKNPFLASDNIIEKLREYSQFLPNDLARHTVNKIYFGPERYEPHNATTLIHNTGSRYYEYGRTSGKL